MSEKQPAQQEVTEAELEAIGRYALFDQLVDYAHRGGCTVAEAIDEYKASLAEDVA